MKKEHEKHKVTYHDSCYLGRYNDVYDSPRKSLNKVAGLDLVEMERNKSKGFCCGAGGGRMFLEDEEGGRINEERAKEALGTNADTIASACPFCMTMMTDGVKHFEKTEEVASKRYCRNNTGKHKLIHSQTLRRFSWKNSINSFNSFKVWKVISKNFM